MEKKETFFQEEAILNQPNLLEEIPIYGFVSKSPEDKLRSDVNRSGLEKLCLFTKMYKRGKMLDKAIAESEKKSI